MCSGGFAHLPPTKGGNSGQEASERSQVTEAHRAAMGHSITSGPVSHKHARPSQFSEGAARMRWHQITFCFKILHFCSQIIAFIWSFHWFLEAGPQRAPLLYPRDPLSSRLWRVISTHRGNLLCVYSFSHLNSYQDLVWSHPNLAVEWDVRVKDDNCYTVQGGPRMQKPHYSPPCQPNKMVSTTSLYTWCGNNKTLSRLLLWCRLQMTHRRALTGR